MEIVSQITINNITAGSIYTLITLGFTLTYNTTKFFNLAHGIVATVDGYIVFLITKTLNINLAVGVIGGIITAGLIGFLLEKVFLGKPL